MGFKLSSEVYDFLKRLVQVGLPAVSTLYFTLGQIWGFPVIEEVVGTFAAIAVFLGVIIGISKHNYETSGDAYDGKLLIRQDSEHGLALNLDLRGSGDAILEKDHIVLRTTKQFLKDESPIDVVVNDDPASFDN